MYLVSPYGAICRIIEQVTKVYETFKIDAYSFSNCDNDMLCATHVY